MKDFARNSKLLDMVQEGPSEIEILQKEICVHYNSNYQGPERREFVNEKYY